MRQKLDIDTWTRKDHFHFFRSFDEPFFGITAAIDCTRAYDQVNASPTINRPDGTFGFAYRNSTIQNQ